MDSEGVEKKPQWKQIWQLTSGIYFETPNDVVLQKLRAVSDELLNGLKNKKNNVTTTDPKATESAAAAEEASIRKNCPKKLFPFIEKLKECLDLDLIDAWSLFCYYLINEYRGSINTITTYLSTSTNMLTFLMNLWECHTMERMIKLKILKNLFSFYKSPSHPYSNEYKEILEHQLNITALRKSYIEQLTQLICEQPNYRLQMTDNNSFAITTPNVLSLSFRGSSVPSSFTNHLTIHSDFMQQPQIIQAHAERNCREIIEILQILILIVNYNGILPSELETIFGLFKMHSFGRQESYFNNNNNNNNNNNTDSNNSAVLEELKLKIMYNEIALFLKCIDITPSVNTEWINMVKKLLDHHVINGVHHLNIEHGPILFGWMAFQLKTINLIEQTNDDGQFLKCRQMAIKSVQLHVFTMLHRMLTHSMFKNQNIVSKIVRRSIYNHLSFVCETFDGDGSLAQHNGIYDLLCELLTSTALAKEFCGKDDYGVHSLFSTAIENFPIDFISLSMFAQSISATGIVQYRKYIRERLENLPIYCEYYNPENIQLKLTSTAMTTTASNENENELMLMSDYKPFDKINWIIPAGTSVIIKDSTIDGGVIKNYPQSSSSSSTNNTNSTIYFRTSVNYFTILHNEINQMFCDTLKYTEINVERKLRILAGLKYITNELHFIENPNDITNEMVHPIEMIIDILQKFKLQKQPPIDLLIQCFKICTELLPLFECEILQRIIALQILPIIHNNNNNNHARMMMMDYRSLALGVNFDSSLIGSYLINFEKNTGTYDFLMSYLKFLKSYSKLSLQNVNAVELPGLVFILREIFPHMHSWRFACEQNRQEIYIAILEYFFDILQLPAEQLRMDKPRTILRNVCVYSLLQLDNGMILLRFIAMGNSHLENRMQLELNWMIGSQSGLNLIIQLSMTILMQILRLRNCIMIDGDPMIPKIIVPDKWYNNNYMPKQKHQSSPSHNNQMLSPIETIIYTQPKQWDTLRIIPVVTSYMDNIFNRRLPILSCRLLRRFAIEFQMSLLACLDMEPDQLRLIFLQRLENHLEIDALKIAIIEFVDACIVKQPGLTQAFFKINYAADDDKRLWGRLLALRRRPSTNKKTYHQLTDGILMYMSEYLDVILNEPKTIVSPILSGIMSLFHTLWKNNMQSLVQKLIEKNHFWQSLTNILFFSDSRDINNNIRAYSQLFNIISIELYRTMRQRTNPGTSDQQPPASQSELNVDLKNAIEKFLSIEYFQKWIDNILDNIPIVENVDDVNDDHHQHHHHQISTVPAPEWLCRLQSFKDLLTIIMRNIKLHNILLLNDSIKYLLNKLLKLLVKHLQLSNDYRPLIVIAELYLIVLISNKCTYTETVDEDKQLIEHIYLLLNTLTIDYAEMPERVRESILAITFKIIDLYWTTTSDQVMPVAIQKEKEPQIALNFIRTITKLFCLELNEIEMRMMVKNQNYHRIDTIDDDDENCINNNNNGNDDENEKDTMQNLNADNNSTTTKKKLSIILIINLLKKMLLNFQHYDNEMYPYEKEILEQQLPYRILNCLNKILPVYQTKQITIELLDLLIVMAKGKCSMELMNCPIVDYLWLKLLPPTELLQQQQQQQLMISGTSSGTSSNKTSAATSMSKSRMDVATATNNTLNNSLTINRSSNLNHNHHQQQHKHQQQQKIKSKQMVNNQYEMKWQTTNEWWLIYAKGIQFITTLLKKHSYRFLRDTLMFVGIHEEYLMDSILLSKYTMDSNARYLIKSTLEFLNELVRFEKEWRLEHQQSLINLMRCVQIILNHSVSLIYRPKLLKRLMNGNENDMTTINVRIGGGGGVGVGVFGSTSPGGGGGNQFDAGCNPVGDTLAAELIQPMNDLTEMIISSVKCLLTFSPKLLDLLTAPEFTPSNWHPLIEIQFNAPKLSVDLHLHQPAPQLTFGILLSAIGIFTKTLNLQHYEFDEIPLNDVFKKSKCRDEYDLNRNGNDRIDDGRASSKQSRAENQPGDTQQTNNVDGNLAATELHPVNLISNTDLRGNPFTKSSISMTSVGGVTAAGSSTVTNVSHTGNTGNSLTLPSYDILRNLDKKLCVTALEYLLTLLASQSLLAIKDIYLSNREKQLIKRELSTEIIQFHDFVKKRSTINDGGGGSGVVTKGSLYRKKYGIRLYKNVCNTIKKRSKNVDNLNVINEDDPVDDNDNDGDDDDDDDDDDHRNADYKDNDNVERGQSTLSRIPSNHRVNSMRVNVMRKVHLTTKQQQMQQEQLKTPSTSEKSPFNLTTYISPIVKATTPTVMTSRTSNIVVSSTPMDQQQQQQKLDIPQGILSWNNGVQLSPAIIAYHEPIEPTFTGLSDVNLVEEDYFHFLSNLFTVICQHE